MSGKVRNNFITYEKNDDYCIMNIFNKRIDQVFKVLISNEDIERVKKGYWGAYYDKTTQNYYVRGGIDGKKIQLHRYITRCPRHLTVDHINRNSLDNRRENLRCVTYKENAANRKELWSSNKSGYKHISWKKSNNKWVVQINYKHIGCAKTLEEAIQIRDEFLKGGDNTCQ